MDTGHPPSPGGQPIYSVDDSGAALEKEERGETPTPLDEALPETWREVYEGDLEPVMNLAASWRPA